MLLVPVIFFYIVCSRKIHRTLSSYLQKRFPGMGRWHSFLSAYRIVFSFGTVLVDRAWLGICKGAALEEDVLEQRVLEDAIRVGRGVVLLMAHVGNWQAALAQLTALPARVHVLMDYDENAVTKHYFELQSKGKPFEIINVNGPFGGMLAAAAALRQGDLVVIMGDRYIDGHSVTASFYNSPVRISTSAYMLAATAEAPVVVLLAANTGVKHFQVRAWDCFYPQYKGRDSRANMLQECAERYLASLEAYLQEYPYQWYNFYNFWFSPYRCW